jgi:NADH:ubiquinone oxidoreductase subunit F (NADH-binding)
MTTPTTTGLLDSTALRLGDHHAVHGPLPPADAVAIALHAGLTGRGGAGFPTAVKLRSVAEAAARTGRQPVVVANGAEGEPAAAKDRMLLTRAPHLVLDGMAVAAHTLGATTTVLAAEADLIPALHTQLAERSGRSDVRLHPVPRSFLAGEESALVAAIDGDSPLPRGKQPPVRERGVAGRPTLVLKVETLARMALLARGEHGATDRTLVTRHLERAGLVRVDVLETDLGVPLGELLPLDGDVQAVLIGGYHGNWVETSVARHVPLDRQGLSAVGASMGAGVLAALPSDRCGVRETARIVEYLARESSGQCGPCLNGLPRIAAALQMLARPALPPPTLLGDVRRWAGLVAGRGACSHPDGTVRLVASALGVFAGEFEAHGNGVCTATSPEPFLPTTDGVR